MTRSRRALIVGWLCTVGDIECLEVVQRLLVDRGIDFDVASPLPEVMTALGRSAELRDPAEYSHLIIVCGPFLPKSLLHTLMLDRYSHCTRIGVNLSMIANISEYQPFDALFARDSGVEERPDLSFLYRQARTPVVGLLLVPRQLEYGSRQAHAEVSAAINGALESVDAAVLELSTLWPPRDGAAVRTTNPAHFEAVLGRLDLLVTTRLHGLVLGLKTGIPVLAVDPIRGGDKVSAQARTLGWPWVLGAERATTDSIAEAVHALLGNPVDVDIASAQQSAAAGLAGFEDWFDSALRTPASKTASFGPGPTESLREKTRRYLSRLR